MEFGYTKSLATLCVTLLLSACGGDGGATGSNVSWVSPSQRTDGTAMAMSEIAGYRIYYGTTEGKYPGLVEITDGSLQQVSMNVPAGVYFVVITTYDQNGRESLFSSPPVKVQI